MKRVLLIAALLVYGVACGEGDSGLPWPGEVVADVDDLTGHRTGLFRTDGPTSPLVVGSDTLPVTIGYWCRFREPRAESGDPPSAADGLFVRLALPDTSVIIDSEQVVRRIIGRTELDEILGDYKDRIIMAVDGWTQYWEYQLETEPGTGTLYGDMGFNRPILIESLREMFDEAGEREEQYGIQLALAGLAMSVGFYDGLYRIDVPEIVVGMRASWPEATDHVGTVYRGREVVAVEMEVGVVAFEMAGFDQALDSVRFWCPIPRAHHEWNAKRAEFFRGVDSLRTLSGERGAARQSRAREGC